MPRMPGYERQIGLPRSPGRPMFDGRGAAAVADATQGLAGSIGQTAGVLQRLDQQQIDETRRKDIAMSDLIERDAAKTKALEERKTQEDARAWTLDAISNDSMQWHEWLKRAQDTAKPGAPEFTKSLIAAFDEQQSKAMEAAPAAAKQFYAERRAALKVQLHSSALSFEGVAGVKHRETQLDAAVNRAELLAVTQPNAAKTLIAETEALLRDSPSREMFEPKLNAMRERVARAATSGMIERDPRGALKVMDAYFGKGKAEQPWFVQVLDPQAAKVLHNNVQADVHRMDAEARARQAEYVAGVKDQARDMLDMMRGGYAAKPADLLATRKALVAAGPKAAALVQQLDDANQDLAIHAQARVMPQEQRTAEIDALRVRAHSEGSPRLANVVQSLEKLDAKIKAEFKEDPLRAGVTQGLYGDVAPLDTSSMGALMQTLPRRLAQTQLVERRTGVPQSPFQEDDARAIVERLRTMQPAEQGQAVAKLATALGPARAARAADQFDSKDKPLALMFEHAMQATNDGRNTSELVARGARALKDKTAKVDEAALTGWRSSIATEVDALGLADRRMADRMKESAYYIAAAKAAERGGSTPNLRDAVETAVGGKLVERGYGAFVLPSGMTESTFDKRLRDAAPQIAQQATPMPEGVAGSPRVLVGGVAMTVESFARILPSATLVRRDAATYYVTAGATKETQRFVTDLNGKPLVIDIGAVEQTAPRQGTPALIPGQRLPLVK